MKKTEDNLLVIIKEILEINNVNIQNKVEAVGFDSFKFIKFVVMAEDVCGIEFEDEFLDYHRFETIKDIIDYIVGRSK